MQRKIEKTDIEFKLFQEWWMFRQKYYNPQTDEEFEILVEAVEGFVKKYIGTEVEDLAKNMALLHAEDCDARWRNAQKKNVDR